MRVRFRYVAYAASPNAGTQDLERLFQGLWTARQRTMLPAGMWRPPTDVYETREGLIVKMELAGVPEEAIEATLYADQLVISGVRRDEQDTGAVLAYREAGIRYGPFRADVLLPWPGDAARVTATLDNGVLTIVLPRGTDG